MDKSLLIFIAIGIAFIYFITNFIGDIQKEDEKFQNKEYQSKQQYDQFMKKDSIDRDILDFTKGSPALHVKAWNNSTLKKDFLEDFPNFSLMKEFANDRIRGEAFKQRLIRHIDHIELQYFSGKMDPEQAQKELAAFK